MDKSFDWLKKLTYGLFFIIMVAFVLIEAREFLYPIFLAVLFAYLLYPVEKLLEKWGLPRLLANFITIIGAVGFFSGMMVLFYKQLSVFLSDFPTIKEQALQNLDKVQALIDRRFNDDSPSNEHWLRMQLSNALEMSGGVLADFLLAITSTITKIGLIPVYVFLMLYYRNKFLNFILRKLPSYSHPKAQRIVEQISQVTKRYMSGVITVIIILCFINTLGLIAIGIEYAILLGIMSALMNFIPYFGTLIGGAIPLTYAIVVQGDLQKSLGVLVLFLLVQFTENNILTPNITGSRVNINPLFTILSIVVGGMIWGLPGMFVSVPFLGMFKIYCDNNENLSSYSFLLGTSGTEEHALTLEKIKRWIGLNKKGNET